MLDFISRNAAFDVWDSSRYLGVITPTKEGKLIFQASEWYMQMYGHFQFTIKAIEEILNKMQEMEKMNG
jgi:hypothetical protein